VPTRRSRYIRAQELLTGVVFVVAGIAKLVASSPERTIWSSFRSHHPVLAACVIMLEILVGMLLLVGKLSQPARAVAIVMLSAFLVVILRELRSLQPTSCGCFGELLAAQDGSPRQKLMLTMAVDVMLLAATAVAFAVWERSRDRLAALRRVNAAAEGA
jgi:uncharacterized membrane protein YphA (DoxX/SURF4 family)